MLKQELEKMRQEKDRALAAFGTTLNENIILRNERDFARKELCNVLASRANVEEESQPEFHATARGWDCFARQDSQEAMNRLAALDEELGLI